MKKARGIIGLLLSLSLIFNLLEYSITAEALTRPTVRTGWHITYHFNDTGAWSDWGVNPTGCDNYDTSTESNMCYHYLDWDVVSGQLYGDTHTNPDTSKTTVFPSVLPSTGAKYNWSITGQYGHLVVTNNGFGDYHHNFVSYTKPAEPAGSANVPSGMMDMGSETTHMSLRLFKFKATNPNCYKDINDRYLYGSAYYYFSKTGQPEGGWRIDRDSRGLVYALGLVGSIQAYKTSLVTGVTGQNDRYTFFVGQDRLAGEQLNSRGRYPTFDLAIYNLYSPGGVLMDNRTNEPVLDSNGRPVKVNSLSQSSSDTIFYCSDGRSYRTSDKYTIANTWSGHDHTVFRYQCYGHLVANKYSVSYSPNGGTGTMPATSETYDTPFNLSQNKFTRPGYRFLGWSKSSTGGVDYTDGQNVSNLTDVDNGTVNLYAVWEAVEYNVKVHVNEPSGHTGVIDKKH